MSDNVIKLAETTGDAKMWTPEQMLEYSLSEVRSGGGREDVNKALVLFLTTTDGVYDVGCTQAGMSCSEMLALLEVAKAVLLKDMGYVQ